MSTAPLNDAPLLDLSLVLPAYNEADNLPRLIEELIPVLDEMGKSYEVIIVDDGSTDATAEVIDTLSSQHPAFRNIRFRLNQGKASAYMAGFRLARGRVVVTMDADLQDDPGEIPLLLDKLAQGYDVVTGWKHTGKGKASRAIPSVFFNLVVSHFSGLRLHDFNCPFKAYRREALQDLNIYGELHRFIPLLLASRGYAIAEVKVSNRPRYSGSSKYGLARFWRGYLDMLTVLFLTRYIQSPLYFFGMGGLISFFGGGIIEFCLVIKGLLAPGPIGHTAMLVWGVLFIVLGVQLISVGLIAELIINQRLRPLNDFPIMRRKEGGSDNL